MLFAGSENRSVKALVTITFGQNLSFQSSRTDTGQTLDHEPTTLALALRTSVVKQRINSRVTQ